MKRIEDLIIQWGDMMAISKFPVYLQKRCAYDSTKKQKWNTTIQKSGSGRYRSLTNQLYPEWIINVRIQPLTDEDARVLLGFIANQKGGYKPFLWKDPEDYHEQGIILSRVSAGVYQAVMKMGAYLEPVEYIENVSVYVNGVKQSTGAYTVSNGYIVFSEAPSSSAIVTADYDYYWCVRFDDDGMGIEHIFDDINRSERIKLVTAR